MICACVSAVEEIRHLRGSVVTQLCLDYGMIDDAVYFTSGEVLGGVPLRVGDVVNGIAVRDGAQGGWRALRVRNLDLVPIAQACMLCLLYTSENESRFFFADRWHKPFLFNSALITLI